MITILGSGNLRAISYRTQARANCIRFRGITIWNSNKTAKKNEPSFCTFKNRFKYSHVSK